MNESMKDQRFHHYLARFGALYDRRNQADDEIKRIGARAMAELPEYAFVFDLFSSAGRDDATTRLLETEIRLLHILLFEGDKIFPPDFEAKEDLAELLSIQTGIIQAALSGDNWKELLAEQTRLERLLQMYREHMPTNKRNNNTTCREEQSK